MKTETTSLICQQLLQTRTLFRGASRWGIGVAAMAALGCWASQSRVTALCEEVDQLNSQIEAFLNAGGCLDGIRGVQGVVDTLTSQWAGRGIRPGLEMQSERQAATSEARVIWDPRVLRLAMCVEGEAGVRRFDPCAEDWACEAA